VPPAPAPRLTPADDDARAEWERVLRDTPPAQRAAAVQRRFAWLGPLSAPPVLGAAAHADDPDERQRAWQRWVWLASLPAAEPVLLQTPRGPHPYPLRLPGTPSEPVPDLLEAMSRVADAAPPEEAAPDRTAQRLARAERRLEAARQRIARLAEQLEQAGDPDAERAFGDLLLAHLAGVPRGADAVTLPGWDGEPVEIPLDPAIGPAENAARFYDDARRRERAAAQLPPLIATAEAERNRWEGVVAALRGGSLDEAAGRMLDGAADDDGRGGRGEEVRLPFRTFRTSGGLEVRVGRGSADNDRLTFGHSRPGDVWLHARSVPGSHVILRWGSPEHAPPARDLAEAAGLAAWFSKARTSGLVAVDWTRRKHVRKPRGAPPGTVVPQRVKTVFVEPDAALPSRLGVSVEETGGDESG
jgi:predicted ribosome quality control (RQC) complex YloA/Tae2 family protein